MFEDQQNFSPVTLPDNAYSNIAFKVQYVNFIFLQYLAISNFYHLSYKISIIAQNKIL